MSNQFDSELYWWRTESWATHARTGATCYVKDRRVGHRDDKPPDPAKPWRWRILAPNGVDLAGWSASEVAARAAVRRRLAKLPAVELDLGRGPQLHATGSTHPRS